MSNSTSALVQGSANIHAVATTAADLLVTFHNRKGEVTSTYIYPGAASHAQPMLNADSVGGYFHQNVRSLPCHKAGE